jgi:RND family efflux transporter MFP subunit
MRKIVILLLLLPIVLAPPARAADEADDTTCIIKPRVTVQLGSPIAGTLSATLVDRGDNVTKGQVVAQLESSVDQATFALDQLKATNDTAIRSEQADRELSQREMERKQFLVDQKIANLNSLDELQTKVRVGDLRVQQAQMDRKVAELTAERSARELALKSIRSPIDGVVIDRKLSAGEYIYEQTSIMTLAQIDPLSVELVVPVDRYGSIKVGQVATVHPRPPVGGAYPAKVDIVDPVIDAASNTFGVRLSLPNPNHTIPAGIRCDVEWNSGKTAGQ